MRGRASADGGQGHNKGQGGGQQPGGGQGTEGGGNEQMGEGWPKKVDIVAIPVVVAIATTHSRKMTGRKDCLRNLVVYRLLFSDNSLLLYQMIFPKFKSKQ